MATIETERTPDEIDAQVKSNRDTIRIKEKEVSALREHNKLLAKEKEISIFNMVLDFVKIGDTIEFNTGYFYGKGGLRKGDKVEVTKKNKKSVRVKYLNRVTSSYSWGGQPNEKVGDDKRIVASVFGEFVYNNSGHVKEMIKRNSKLKDLLGI